MVEMVLGLGQCRLAKVSSNLVLSPYKGNLITINNQYQTIPAVGISLAPTGLTANTTYYIYVYMNGVTMTLEASTTGHSTDTTSGVEIKTGDATRTLVGMGRIIAGPAWVDTAAQRFVLSWFNRRRVTAYSYLTGDWAPSNTSGYPGAAKSSGTDGKIEFLTWGEEQVELSVNGTGYTPTSTNLGASIFYTSNAVSYNCTVSHYVTSGTVNGAHSIALSESVSIVEGYATATIGGWKSSSGPLFYYTYQTGTRAIING
jgi:hypothetical protein